MTAPVPAGPTDAHAELREALGIALWKEDPDASVKENPRQATTWPPIAAYERMADAVLALPAVRDALDAQETVRRVRKVVGDWSSTAADDPGQAAYTAMRAIARAVDGVI